MKIRFSSDDDLSERSTLELHNIAIRSVFDESNKYYPQMF